MSNTYPKIKLISFFFVLEKNTLARQLDESQQGMYYFSRT